MCLLHENKVFFCNFFSVVHLHKNNILPSANNPTDYNFNAVAMIHRIAVLGLIVRVMNIGC